MRRNVDYYMVLGVPRNVTAEELKRRYRQLVRNLHPDVAEGDPEQAHDRFILVVEAYQCLSDPVRRRTYDALRDTSPPPLRTQSVAVAEQIDDWFRHALHRFEQHDHAGAAAQCRKILALDERHPAARAMLGDICAAAEQWDQALVHYSGAVSAAPRNPAYARKLRAAAEAGQQARAAAERRERAAAQRRRALEALNARHEYAFYTTVLCVGWLVLLLGWAAGEPGPPLASWFPLPVRYALTCLGAGLALGFGLGVNRLPDRLNPPADRPALIYVAAVLTALLALAQFYVAVAVFVVLCLVRDRLLWPLALAFGGAFGLVVALAGLSLVTAPDQPDLWRTILAVAGNLTYPATLLGLGLGRLGRRSSPD